MTNKRHQTGERRPKWFYLILLCCILLISFIAIYSYKMVPQQQSVGYSYKIVPEYERTMKKVVISLKTKNLSIQPISLDIHFKLFQYFPEYTEILLILPEKRVEEVKTRLVNYPVKNKVTLVPFETRILKNINVYFVFAEKNKLIDTGLMENFVLPNGTSWAQDLFEPAKGPDGQNLLLTSDVYKTFYSDESDNGEESVNVRPDNLFLDRLSSDSIKIMRTPLVFMGGNILVDRFNGKLIAFCGGDVLRKIKIIWNTNHNVALKDEKIIKLLRKYLNVDDVIILGKEKIQPSIMFHLDQAMILLPDGIAGVTNVVGRNASKNTKEINEIKLFLSEIKSVLTGLGYKLINIDTSVDSILNHQFYINSIPYTDKGTGQRMLLMPVSNQEPSVAEKGLIQKNISAFESAGCKVVTVPSESTDLKGGIHCLVNVIE